MKINLIVPDTQEGGRSTYVMQLDTDTLISNTSIYRHTFTITPAEGATFADNEYKVNASFCAVNVQVGDSSAEYLLHSDETGQAADWILPLSGVIGKVTGGTVRNWYPCIRIVAGWQTVSEKSVRTLFIDYFDETTNQIVRAPFMTDSNAYKYHVRNFKSQIGTFKAPMSLNTVAVEIAKA